MNKVNLCWVLSDGRKGHDIQSATLADKISTNYLIHTFHLKQPWVTFAPRVTPGFRHALKWKNNSKPNLMTAPNIIITTGRKAAAVGKYFSQVLRSKKVQVHHIQILNPKDGFKNYDLILLPKHDQATGPNVITFNGSIHPFNDQWFVSKIKEKLTTTCAIVIGNPADKYFDGAFAQELKSIRSVYPDKSIVFCGSPRLSIQSIKKIKPLIQERDVFWYAGIKHPNPYQNILRQSKHIFVTSDSINMMNESAGSHAHVTLLATDFIPSPKHHRFIASNKARWSTFDSSSTEVIPVPYALNEVITNHKLQKLLNSPTSSNSG